MSQYLLVLVAFILFGSVLALLAALPAIRRKVVTILVNVKKATFFNNTIRSITLAYLETCIQFKIQIDLVRKGATSPAVAAAMVIYLVGYVIVCAYVVMRNRADLDRPQYRAMFERLYPEVALDRSPWTVLYYPSAMLRRFAFVLITIIFIDYPYLQTQYLVFTSSLYIIWYGLLRPHLTRKMYKVELLNEFFFVMCQYHLFVYTEFVRDLQTQFSMGYSYLAYMGLLCACNVVVIIHGGVDRFRSGRRRALLLKLRDQRMKVIKAAILAQKVVTWKRKIARIGDTAAGGESAASHKCGHGSIKLFSNGRERASLLGITEQE